MGAGGAGGEWVAQSILGRTLLAGGGAWPMVYCEDGRSRWHWISLGRRRGFSLWGARYTIVIY